jgi:hypothetical protein
MGSLVRAALSLSMIAALSALSGCAPGRASTGDGGTSALGGGVSSSGGSGGASSLGGSMATSSGGTTESGGKSAAGGAAAGGSTNTGGTTTSVGGSSIGSAGKTGSGGTTSGSGGSTGGTTGSGGSTGTTAAGPCDIYAAGNTPCVAAHSTVRALYAAYSGKLYQVRRASDKTTKDILVATPGGFVDSPTQDTFCTGTTCTISYIYDQSELKNDLPMSPPPYWFRSGNLTAKEASATAGKVKLGGHTAYGVYVVADGLNTYRNNFPNGVPVGNEPETIYAVLDGKRYNDRCCFDYGNVETSGQDDGDATMDTLTLSNIILWGHGTGTGPWVMDDLENGVYAGDQKTGSTSSNTPLVVTYATLMVRTYAEDHYILKGGDAQSGKMAVKWDGKRPPGYTPMKKQGAVQLGCGGDGSCGGMGTFFEGAIAKGVSTDATDDAIQANIVAAGYGR